MICKPPTKKSDRCLIFQKIIRPFSRFIQIAIVFVCAICLSLFLVPSTVWAEPIQVGMSAAFNGTSRSLGNELYRGSMAYLNIANRQGGVNGHSIAIKAYDDGYNPLPALQNTVQLVAQDKVFALMNYVGTPTVTRVLPLLKKYEDQHFLLLFPFTGAQPHRQPPYDKFVFNLRASYREETGGLVDHFLQIGRKRIAVFYQIDAYGRSGWDGVQRKLKEQGLSIVGEATYRRGTQYSTSFKPQVEAIRKANPDAIISVGSYQACAGFVRDARDAGWDLPIANVSFVGSESLLKLLLETGKKVKRDYTQNLINSQVVPSYEEVSLPAVQEYRTAIAAYQGKPPKDLVKEEYKPLPYSFVSFEGFLNAKLLVEILKHIPDLSDRATLQPTLERLPPLDLGIGVPIQFKSDSHQGLHQIYYTTVRDDRFVPIKNWQHWVKKS